MRLGIADLETGKIINGDDTEALNILSNVLERLERLELSITSPRF